MGVQTPILTTIPETSTGSSATTSASATSTWHPASLTMLNVASPTTSTMAPPRNNTNFFLFF